MKSSKFVISRSPHTSRGNFVFPCFPSQSYAHTLIVYELKRVYSRLCWYVGEKYLRGLKSREEYPSRVLQSLEALAEFLVLEARVLERGSDQGTCLDCHHILGAIFLNRSVLSSS